MIGDLGGAERGIEQMLRIDPDYLPALTLKARVLLDQNKPVQALKAAERAIALEPENHKHSLLKALVLSHADRREEADSNSTNSRKRIQKATKHEWPRSYSAYLL